MPNLIYEQSPVPETLTSDFPTDIDGH